MEKKEWTIMVYLAGDNNLSEDMISSLKWIRDIISTKKIDHKINVVAIYDSNYPTVDLRFYDFKYSNLFNTSGSLKLLSEIGTDLPEEMRGSRGNRRTSGGTVDGDDRAYIYRFVNAIRFSEKYAAKNYALIMSGHADSVIGKVMFRDESNTDKITLDYLMNKIFRRSTSRLPQGEKLFSVLAFDSCMMGTIEVGYEFKSITDYLVASQGFSPTQGWNYSNILEDLIRNDGNLSPEAFAEKIVRRQIEFSTDYNTGGRSMCLSAVRLKHAKDLSDSIKSLAEEFNKILDLKTQEKDLKAEGKAIIKTFLRKVIHDSHYASQTFLHEQAVDIQDFAENLISQCDLKIAELAYIRRNTESSFNITDEFTDLLNTIKAKCEKIITEHKKYLVLSMYHGPDYQFSKGTSIFLPWTQLAFYMIDSGYQKLRFKKENRSWYKLIETYTTQTLRGRTRAGNDVKFIPKADLSVLEWMNQSEILNEENSSRANSARANSAKANSAKGNDETFYKLFRRFRNHPIFHDVSTLQDWKEEEAAGIR